MLGVTIYVIMTVTVLTAPWLYKIIVVGDSEAVDEIVSDLQASRKLNSAVASYRIHPTVFPTNRKGLYRNSRSIVGGQDNCNAAAAAAAASPPDIVTSFGDMSGRNV